MLPFPSKQKGRKTVGKTNKKKWNKKGVCYQESEYYCTGTFSSFFRLYSFSVFVGRSDCFGMRVAFIKWVTVYLIKNPALIGFNNFTIDKFNLTN